MNSEESTESVDFFCKSCIQTPCLLCNKTACYHSAMKTQVTVRIFRLSPIHASMNLFNEFNEFPWNPVLFRENSIIIYTCYLSSLKIDFLFEIIQKTNFPDSSLSYCKWLSPSAPTEQGKQCQISIWLVDPTELILGTLKFLTLSLHFWYVAA